eukprot:4260294-Amphidinium_carterae.1
MQDWTILREAGMSLELVLRVLHRQAWLSSLSQLGVEPYSYHKWWTLNHQLREISNPFQNMKLRPISGNDEIVKECSLGAEWLWWS